MMGKQPHGFPRPKNKKPVKVPAFMHAEHRSPPAQHDDDMRSMKRNVAQSVFGRKFNFSK